MAQQDENGKEHLVYYISQTLIGYDFGYTTIEKQCLSLVFATNKLRHYLLNEKVDVVMKFDPLKHLLFYEKNLSRCLDKWVMLTKFDLKFVPQKEIKRQALIDHLVDTPSPLDFPNHDTFPDEDVLIIDDNDTWELYFDCSKC